MDQGTENLCSLKREFFSLSKYRKTFNRVDHRCNCRPETNLPIPKEFEPSQRGINENVKPDLVSVVADKFEVTFLNNIFLVKR